MEKDKIFKRLKDIREDKDLSQRQLAEKLGVAEGTYSKWERELELMPLKRLNQVCNIMNCSMDYVIGLTNNKEAEIKLETLSKMTTGVRLREFRKTNHLTQTDLAEFLNTGQSTISGYENAKSLIISAFACQIALRYQVSLDWLCGRKEKNEPQ